MGCNTYFKNNSVLVSFKKKKEKKKRERETRNSRNSMIKFDPINIIRSFYFSLIIITLWNY